MSGPADGTTIIYADGNEGHRIPLASALRKAGFRVREAATAAEALRLARDGPGLVILDGTLPDMPGAELAQRLQTDPATSSLPVLRLAHPVEGGLPLPPSDPALPRPRDPQMLVHQVQTMLRLQRVEADLRASEARLQDILDNAPVVVHVKDREGRYLLVNRHWEQLFHHSRDEVLGKSVKDIYAPARAEAFLANDRQVLDAGIALQFEEVAPEDDGPHIFLSVKFPLLDSSGVPYAVCGISTDITQRKRVEAELNRTAVELGLARRIQQRLFPGPIGSLTELGIGPGRVTFDVGGGSYSADAIGGDYYDYLPLRGGLGLAIGDVSGHGIGPALLTAEVRALLRAFAQTQADPGMILALTNRVLVPDIESDRFITLALARFDPLTASLCYSSAGHPSGLVLDVSGGVKAHLDSNGVPLGILSDAVFPTSDAIPLAPGDMVLFLTDGVLDARSPQGAPFGLSRALELVHARRGDSAQQIVSELYQEVHRFAGERARTDDLTATVVKVMAPDPSCQAP